MPLLDHSRNDKSLEDPISYQKILNSIKVNDIQKCQHLLDGCKVRKEIVIWIIDCIPFVTFILLIVGVFSWIQWKRRGETATNTEIWRSY